MRLKLLVLVVAIAGCSSIPARLLPKSPEPTFTPAVGFEFGCRLPVSWLPSAIDANAANSGAGFISLPAAALTGREALPQSQPFIRVPAYDEAVHRWLPVPRSAISPDGLHYAYADYDPPVVGAISAFRSMGVQGANAPLIADSGRVHLVDAQTGVDRVVFAGKPAFAIVDLTQSKIYLARFKASFAGTGSSGLFVMDANGGTPAAIPGADYGLDRGGWSVIAGGSAWGTRFTQGPGAMWPGNQVVRFDLQTHAIEAWFTAPNEDTVEILGFDHGTPLVLARKAVGQGPAGIEVALATGPELSTKVMSTDNANDPVPSAFGVASTVADTHGTWMGGIGNLWRFDGGALHHVSVLDPQAVVSVGGSCL